MTSATLPSLLKRLRPSKWTVAAIAVHAIVVIFAFYNTLHLGITHSLEGSTGGDGGQQVWFLADVAHEFARLHLSFYSATVNVPRGVDLANMTSMPLLGALTIPVTALWGVVTSYNLLLMAAFFTAGLSMYFVALRWVKWQGAALFGSLVFSVSPYMVGQGGGHIFLTTTALLPLILLVVDEILIRQHWRWYWSGIALAALVSAQILISIEVATSAILFTIGGTVVMCIAFRKQVVSKLAYASRALAVTAVASMPVLVWFAYAYFYGKAHTVGDIRPAWFVANLSANALSFILPGTNQVLHFGFQPYADSLVSFGGTHQVFDPFENAAYFGVPLLSFIAYGIWRLRKNATVWVFAFLAASAALLSMGSHLRIGHRNYSIPLPFWFISKAPVLRGSIAIRWDIFTSLFFALLVGIIISSLHDTIVSRGVKNAKGLLVGTIAIVVAITLSLLPNWPYPAGQESVPAWFTSSAVSALPSDAVLVTYPLAYTGSQSPMFWQSIANFKFKLVGGEVGAQAVNLGATQTVLAGCALSPTFTSADLALVPTMRAEFASWHVTTLVVPKGFAPNESCGITAFTDVTGHKPVLEHKSWVWNLANG